MRVPFRHNHKSRRRYRLKVIVVSLFIIALGMLLPKLLSAVSAVVMYPVHATNAWLEESSSLIPTFIRDRQALVDQIESLENELVSNRRRDTTQQRLREENNQLRRLLGIEGETRVAAAVIARPNELPYDLLQIDRGSDHGVEIGSPVFAGQDIVIGLVSHVTSRYSFVRLITSPNFEATAFISGPDVVVTMEGVGNGIARVRVPQGIALNLQDLVYLPSVEPGVFGRISYVENRPTQPEQYGYISPDLAISSLHWVAVGQLSQISQSPEEMDANLQEFINTSLLNSSLDDVFASSTATTSSSTATTTEEVIDSADLTEPIE